VTRIIAGSARGRRLTIPAAGTRPTSDRVRESMFASIEARLAAQGRSWVDVAVCDLWSGSGAIALEAWSRGATRVLAVDRSAGAIRAIEGNIEQLGAEGVEVMRTDVMRALAGPPAQGPFDVLIADPPYDDDAAGVQQALAQAVATGWLGPAALVVVERDRRGGCPLPSTIEISDERTYGDTVLWYGHATDGREE